MCTWCGAFANPYSRHDGMMGINMLNGVCVCICSIGSHTRDNGAGEIVAVRAHMPIDDAHGILIPNSNIPAKWYFNNNFVVL